MRRSPRRFAAFLCVSVSPWFNNQTSVLRCPALFASDLRVPSRLCVYSDVRQPSALSFQPSAFSDQRQIIALRAITRASAAGSTASRSAAAWRCLTLHLRLSLRVRPSRLRVFAFIPTFVSPQQSAISIQRAKPDPR